MKINRNRIGPKIFPSFEKEAPTPIPITKSVPQKRESPIPANGPIKAVFIDVIVAVSKFSGFFAFSSSIETTIPMINVDSGGAVLKNSR